jgi:hypothetical protein
MRFGLLYEAQRPFAGTSVDWNTLYKETIEQCVLAEKVGFDNLWFVEQVILIMQTETIPHEQVLQSIEMFGKHVIPACRAEAGARPVPAAV